LRLSTLFLTFVSLTCSPSPLFPSDPQIELNEKIPKPTDSPKKYNFSICAIFKNEAAYFREWLEYNLLIGVDHFYLYNNGSTDESASILEPYIQKGVVTLIDWPDRCDPNTPENAPYKWVVYTQL